MARERVLLVEDDEDVVRLVRTVLEEERFRVVHAPTAEAAVRLATAGSMDLVVLDLVLPDGSGLDVCRRLRREPSTASIPILMLTSKSKESDIVAGLELGADDYVTKPFSPQVLLARIRTVLRRSSKPAADEGERRVELRGLEIDPVHHEVALDGRPLKLTLVEFRVLHLLALHPGRVYTRAQILQNVHGDDYHVTDRAVDVQIAGLRAKLGEWAENVETVRGVGYRVRP